METNEILSLLSLLTIFDLALLAGFLWCRSKLKSYARMVQIMTAYSSAVPTDPELIQEWVLSRNSYERGSLRWNAYNDRLKKEGKGE